MLLTQEDVVVMAREMEGGLAVSMPPTHDMGEQVLRFAIIVDASGCKVTGELVEPGSATEETRLRRVAKRLIARSIVGNGRVEVADYLEGLAQAMRTHSCFEKTISEESTVFRALDGSWVVLLVPPSSTDDATAS